MKCFHMKGMYTCHLIHLRKKKTAVAEKKGLFCFCISSALMAFSGQAANRLGSERSTSVSLNSATAVCLSLDPLEISWGP